MMTVAVLPPVTWLQDPAEFGELLAIFRELEPKCVLEIGSFYGGTLWHWINNLQTGALVVSVDMMVPRTDARYRGILRARALWQGWADELNIKLITINDDSIKLQTIEAVKDYAPFDFIFVDGGHEYETVDADYHNYYPMLRTGGVMAFHDIAENREPGVMRFWDELKDFRPGRELIFAPTGTLGIGVLQK